MRAAFLTSAGYGEAGEAAVGAQEDLDRVTAWLRVFGMVNSAPGFNQQPAVINGCSDLFVAVLGASGYAPQEIIASQDTYDLIVERGAQAGDPPGHGLSARTRPSSTPNAPPCDSWRPSPRTR